MLREELRHKQRIFLLLAILLLQLSFCLTVVFNITIARQVLGFVYFTFIPGFIFVVLLKLNLKFSQLETLILSVGFSMVFLMIVGLLINEFGYLLGCSQPLSLIPLMVILNFLTLIGTTILYFKGYVWMWKHDCIKRFLPFAVLPIISVMGAMCVNVYRNNLLLLFLIVAIAVLFTVFVLFDRKLRFSESYPFAVVMIAIALLYHSSFISKYFVAFGSDVAGEYFTFKVTDSGAYWNLTHHYVTAGWLGFGRLNSMLSVTILPTIFSKLLNIDSIWMFKILVPLFFCLVPLGLYQLWQGYIGKKYAFVSAFLLMAQATFYTEMLGLNRQMIAELFFVLLLLVIVNRRLEAVTKMLCFILFSFGLITSHYGVAEIFIFFISVALISLTTLKRPSRYVTVDMIIFFLVVMFCWYIYSSRSAVFESFLEFGDYVINQLGDFFNPETRGRTVLRGLGLEAPPTVWNMVSRLFAYLIEALIVIGFFGLITKRVKIDFDKEYFTLTIIAMFFLGMLIIVPGLAKTMNITRFYHILLFFLSPLYVLGAETSINIIRKRNVRSKVLAILLIILVPYFLFQSNFVYEVTGSDSWSVSLSLYRMDSLRLQGLMGYTNSCNVFGAQWLSRHIVVANTKIYADFWSRSTELRCYGLIYLEYIETLSNTTEIKDNGVIYLRSFNTVEEKVVSERYLWNTSDLPFLHLLNVIYSNGGSEVCKNTP